MVFAAATPAKMPSDAKKRRDQKKKEAAKQRGQPKGSKGKTDEGGDTPKSTLPVTNGQTNGATSECNNGRRQT